MDGPHHVASLLKASTFAPPLLARVESLELPDCWIGAGFVRNAVWDVLHGRPAYATPLNDIDVIYFDPYDLSIEKEVGLEGRLREADPGAVWSVKNQARMHIRNGDDPYRDTSHALTCWCETPTAIAARSIGGLIELIAPLGVEDLLALVVRPTPHFASKMHVYRERVRAKNWIADWPMLRVECCEGDALKAPSS